MVEAHADLKPVGKSGQNTFDKYSYAKLEDYVSAVTPVLQKHGLFMVSSVEDVIRLEYRTTGSGKIENVAQVKVAVRIYHVSGEWIETTCFGEGQDRADKAIYKAVTGARKYAIAAALGLATTDDPEADSPPDTRPAAKPVPIGIGQANKPPIEKPTLGPATERATKAIAKFKEIGVDQTAMETQVGKTAGGWGDAEFNKLNRWYKEVKAEFDKQSEAAIAAIGSH